MLSDVMNDSTMAASAPVPGASMTDFAVELDALVAEVMVEWKIRGLAVAVVQNGKVPFMRPYGLRDVEARLKVTTDTQLQLMSLSPCGTMKRYAV